MTCRRVILGVLLFIAMMVLARECAAEPPPKKYATLLAGDLDDLLKLAIVRPYGTAWADTGGDDEGRKKSPRTINLDPLNSPSAGMVFWYAGELLHQPKYTQAARDVARALIACQQPAGKFPTQVVFNPANLGNKEKPSPLADRASTRAGLALLLTIIEGHEKDPENDSLVRSATRAATWLLRQQADGGGWPVLFPPDGPANKQVRIARFDLPDTRDSTFTMLLAYEVLGDPMYRRSAERSVEFIDHCRAPENNRPGSGLWGPAYTLPGGVVEGVSELPRTTDILACRHAMQTTLGLYMILSGGPNFIRVEKSLKGIGELKKSGEKWYRWYLPGGDPSPIATLKLDSSFGQAPEEDARYVNDFGITRVAKTVESIGPGGREKFLDRLRVHFGRNQVLANTIAGFWDGEIPTDFPSAPAEVGPYLEGHADLFKQVDAGLLPNLASKVVHLWALYLRAKIEGEVGNAK